MVLHDPESAAVRIEALKKQISERNAGKDGAIDPEALKKAKKIVDDAKEIAMLEKQLDKADEDDLIEAEKAAAKAEGREYKDPEGTKRTDEEIKEDQKQEALDNDEQLQAINGMKSKADVRNYLEREFGYPTNADMKFDDLKKTAITKREERVLEAM